MRERSLVQDLPGCPQCRESARKDAVKAALGRRIRWKLRAEDVGGKK